VLDVERQPNGLCAKTRDEMIGQQAETIFSQAFLAGGQRGVAASPRRAATMSRNQNRGRPSAIGRKCSQRISRRTAEWHPKGKIPVSTAGLSNDIDDTSHHTTRVPRLDEFVLNRGNAALSGSVQRILQGHFKRSKVSKQLTYHTDHKSG